MRREMPRTMPRRSPLRRRRALRPTKRRRIKLLVPYFLRLSLHFSATLLFHHAALLPLHFYPSHISRTRLRKVPHISKSFILTSPPYTLLLRLRIHNFNTSPLSSTFLHTSLVTAVCTLSFVPLI